MLHASRAGRRHGLSILDWTAAWAVVLIWALNFIVGKLGVMQMPPLLLMALRFAVVAALLIPFLKPLPGRWPTVVALSVVLGVMHFGMMFAGLRGIDAGPAAIAIQLTVPFSALLALLFYRERLGLWQLAGMLVAFVGVYLLAGNSERAPSLPHFLLVVCAAFAWAFANVLIKRLGPVNPFTLNAWVALLACPQLLLLSLVLEDGQMSALRTAGWQAWGAIAYMAIGSSIIAYGLWYHLIGKHAMNSIVPMTLLSPVLAVALAVPLLGEAVTSSVLIGGAVTLAGVAMIQFLRPRLPEPPVPS
ncbi:MAG: EamA family transporter [Rhodospirillales bacterium]